MHSIQGPGTRLLQNNFDAIRMLAALLVIYGHSYPLLGVAGPGWLGSSVQTVGVKIFFCISGFLIAKSWFGDGNVERYLLKRSLRIFPGLFLNVLVVCLIIGPLVTNLSLIEYFEFTHNVLLFKQPSFVYFLFLARSFYR